jgi:hypothetical protein
VGWRSGWCCDVLHFESELIKNTTSTLQMDEHMEVVKDCGVLKKRALKYHKENERCTSTLHAPTSGSLFYLRDLFMPVESETIKGTLMRSKMENLCRELQKQNKTVLVLWILLVVCNAIPCNSTAHCRRTANASRKTKWSKGESFVRTCVRI